MSTNIVRIADWGLTDEQIELIKTAFARHATNDELALFVQTCNRLRLDPFARQIFLVKRFDTDLDRYVATTQVSIDGFRLIAERTGEYRGQTVPQWCGKDGVWVDVWLDPTTPPVAARVGVHRETFREPLVRTALWSAYAQHTKNGNLTSMWRTHGVNQLLKCAEALALRAAFPNELSGVYTNDELPAESAPAQTYAQPANDAQPAPKPRSAPRLSVVNKVPATLAEFLGTPAKEAAPVAKPAPAPEPVAELVTEGETVYDSDTGEVQELADSEPPAPPARSPAAKRPDGNVPVWSHGDHKGKSYLDTPRKYLIACLDGAWGKNATSRQLEWARHAVYVRTEKARAEGRE